MEVYQRLPELCQKLVVNYWINSLPKSQIAWQLHNCGYDSPHWGIYNMALRNAYVIDDGFALMTFNEKYMDELHDVSQSPIPTLSFNTFEFANILRLIGSNTITFEFLEIRGVPSPTSWRYIQMLSNGAEYIRIKSVNPFEALLGFDDSMFKKLVMITKDSNSTHNETSVHSQSHYRFAYGPKDLSVTQSKLGSPDCGIIEFNGEISNRSSYMQLADQVLHIKPSVGAYQFKALLSSNILGEDATFDELDAITLKVTDVFEWGSLAASAASRCIGDKVYRLILNGSIPPNLDSMFRNLYSLTMTPSIGMNLNDLMQCIPASITNLHLDLSKFIHGFSFKLPASIVFLEVMCHYLPYSHQIDTSNSYLEVLALTMYSESKQSHLKLTHLPSTFHFMEIRRCIKSEFVPVDPQSKKIMNHIRLERGPALSAQI